MRTFGLRAVVLVLTAGVVSALMMAPSAAAGRLGAPWVVAASPTSVTLDWPGHGSFRVYSSREGGGSKHSVKASTSQRKVTGLRPGTMYCFQVARSNGSGRSKTYCHSTPKRVSAPSAASIGVVTFNVCGTVCGRWPARRAAVVQRILESRADVVTLQEATKRIPELMDILYVHGFDLVANSQNEAIFARRDVFRREAYLGPGCRRDITADPATKWPDWDKQRSHNSGHLTFTWDEPMQRWVAIQVICSRKGSTSVPRSFGTIVLPDRRTAPWVSLLHVASGRNVTVVSAHLSPGRSSGTARVRDSQARVLGREVRRRTDGPVIVTGDLNASRARGRDLPGKRLRRAGFVDAYDQATSFSKAYVSSSSGFASKPRRNVRYGDHIDRIFVPRGFRVSDWAVVAPLRRGRNVRPLASDHNPVRATVWLP